MKDRLIIADGVTLWTLNPHNNALKNDFMEALLMTAFMATKLIVSAIGNKKFRVVRGFESGAYIKHEVDSTPSVDLMRHARGQALELSWTGVTDDELMLAANIIYGKADEPVKIVVNSDTKSLYIARGVDVSCVVEKTLNEYRMIQRAA